MLKIFVMTAALAVAHAETFEIDANHSSITFRIRHFVGKVRGRFDKFSGSFDYEKGKPSSWKATADIDAASINTNHGGRDAHLRNADFFDVEKCPKIAFQSTKVTDVKDESATLHGDLTMHCVTKPVALKLEFGGVEKDARGTLKAGMTATGKIDRREWGITWNKASMLGDEVDVELEIEGEAGSKPKKS